MNPFEVGSYGDMIVFKVMRVRKTFYFTSQCLVCVHTDVVILMDIAAI